MARANYIQIQCKSALNRVTGMPFHWSLNPYRGCVHACHYCYARATHAYYGLNADEDFETQVFVKANIVEILRKELRKPSWPGEQVAIGTATDAYQPAEGQFRLTRGVLEALLERRNPAGIVTKSTLILRDIDLWAELARHATVRVYFTVTTIDKEIWDSMEPGTPPPMQRMKAMRALTDAGVTCGVLMAPVLPGITDSEESIRSVAIEAANHGAYDFRPIPLRLAPLVKEHYFRHVKDDYPELISRYQQAYAGQNPPKAYVDKMMERFDSIRADLGFENTPRWGQGVSRTPNPNAPKQLAMAL